MKTIRFSKANKAVAKAIPSFFEKYRHLFYAAAGWLILFALFFSLKFFIKPRYYIHCALDDYIPFIKWFFIPYCLWYFYLLAALIYFGLVSKPDFIRLQSYIFIGMGICFIIYVIFPNGISFRPEIGQNDLISRIMAAMFSIDPPNMVIPSMHVFDAVAVHAALCKSRITGGSRLLVSLSFLLMASICVSTVFVKQHSIMDVFAGVLLAVLLYFPIYAGSSSSKAFRHA